MAFFDELGKKISQTSQGVVQKTKDTAEILKLKSLLSDEEKKVTNIYTEIGKMYYTSHIDSCEPKFEQMFNEVKGSLVKIEDYNEQIRKLKGVLTCVSCGAEVPYSASFCNNCGTKVERPQATPVSGNKCAKCGAVLEDGVAFCTNCGTKVEAQADNSKKCANCGEVLEDGVAFCTNCGTKVEAQQEAVPVKIPLVCPKCNTEIEEGTKFCTGCGNPIS